MEQLGPHSGGKSVRGRSSAAFCLGWRNLSTGLAAAAEISTASVRSNCNRTWWQLIILRIVVTTPTGQGAGYEKQIEVGVMRSVWYVVARFSTRSTLHMIVPPELEIVTGTISAWLLVRLPTGVESADIDTDAVSCIVRLANIMRYPYYLLILGVSRGIEN